MAPLPTLDHVTLADRPLVVCDVDDVVLQFLSPFEAFLAATGAKLLPRSFRLHGNIISLETEMALEDSIVSDMLETFFKAQEDWQTPFTRAVETLQALGRDADVVFLTAMPPRYATERRRLLDRLELSFPMVATESPKGPVVGALHQARPLPVAFIDDMAHNLHSVGDHVEDCLLLHMMPDSEIHRLAPQPAAHVQRARDWPHAGTLLRSHFQRSGD
nr:hypothetical protein [uncultured Gellertiella sp.]